MNAICRDEILFRSRQLMSYGNWIFLLLGGEPKKAYISAMAVTGQGGCFGSLELNIMNIHVRFLMVFLFFKTIYLRL